MEDNFLFLLFFIRTLTNAKIEMDAETQNMGHGWGIIYCDNGNIGRDDFDN